MKLVYITNAINGTTGLQRMISIQTNYFIENYAYKIDIILLEQSKYESEEFFDFHKNIHRYYLNTKRKSRGGGVLSKMRILNKTLHNSNVDIAVVCVDNIFGLFLPHFINIKCKLVYQRHSPKNIIFNLSTHSFKTKCLETIKKSILRFGGNGYDKFVLLTEDHRNDWKHIKNIFVISNPLIIDTRDAKANLDTKTILAVGRHDPVKGFDMLLKIWVKVVEKHPDWKLKILGKKMTGFDLKSMAKKLDVVDSIEFQDYTKNMREEYLKSTIVSCTSRLEGFPLVMIEAMSFGVPVVSFDCPYGPKAIINNSIDGILVKPNDIDMFTTAIIMLIENDSLRKEFGNNAKINVQRFVPEQIMPQWKSLFESLIAN